MKRLWMIPVLALIPAVAYGQYYPHHMDSWHMMGWGWGWGWGFFYWALIILALFLVLSHIMKNTSTGRIYHSGEAPLEILKRRYAKGDISKEEFDRMKKDIE